MLTNPDPQSLLFTSEHPIQNRFSLITLVRKRARSIVDGSPHLIETESRNPVTVALEEISQGKVRTRVPGSPRIEVPGRKDPMAMQAEALALALGT